MLQDIVKHRYRINCRNRAKFLVAGVNDSRYISIRGDPQLSGLLYALAYLGVI